MSHIYVLVCLDCTPLLARPFRTPAGRAVGVVEHTSATGHNRWRQFTVPDGPAGKEAAAAEIARLEGLRRIQPLFLQEGTSR